MAKLYHRLGIGVSDHRPYFEVLLEKKPTTQDCEIVACRIIENP